MYTVDELDVVVALSEIPKPEAGAPAPVVLANEQSLVLSYRTATAPFAFVRFSMPYLHIFGPPNDEALDGHPLWGRGLVCYGAHSVQNSSLVRRLERMNSVHWLHQPKSFEVLNHYIITFHDSTFECVARSVEGWAENILGEDQKGRMSHHLKAGC